MILQTHFAPRRNSISEYRFWCDEPESSNARNSSAGGDDVLDLTNFDLFEPDPINVNEMKVVERYDVSLSKNRFFPCLLPSSSSSALLSSTGATVPVTSRSQHQVLTGAALPFVLSSTSNAYVRGPRPTTNEAIYLGSSHQSFLQLESTMNLIENEVDGIRKANGFDRVKLSLPQHLPSPVMKTAKVPTVVGAGFAALSAHPNLARTQSETSRISAVSARSAESERSRETLDDRWDVKFAQLEQFVLMHGHARVPVRYRLNMSLSKWAKRQRYQYKLKQEGKHSTLSDERELKLVDLGFEWDIRYTVWEERFDELLEFKRKYGHMSVPIVFPEFPKLGSWVKCARRQGKLFARGESSSMTADRAAKLKVIGFTWDARGSLTDSS
jgi:hypothetical protein